MLGKILVRKAGKRVLAGRIVEDEAYLGNDDPAAHAAAGPTARNRVLFGPPGHAYVYFIYGIHYCLNVSCLPKGDAGCVLIRALEPMAGIEQMALARDLDFQGKPPLPRELRRIASGPGRLCEALGITRERDNGKDLVRGGDLLIVDDGYCPEQIATTARIGITRATEHPFRYVIANSEFICKIPSTKKK